MNCMGVSGRFIRASNLYNEVAALVNDKSIANIPTIITLQALWETKRKDLENVMMDTLLSYKSERSAIVEWCTRATRWNGLLTKTRTTIIS